jgi:hypothetical protein
MHLLQVGEPAQPFDSAGGQELNLSIQVAIGVHNAHASIWKKTKAPLDDRDQTSDQKNDV